PGEGERETIQQRWLARARAGTCSGTAALWLRTRGRLARDDWIGELMEPVGAALLDVIGQAQVEEDAERRERNNEQSSNEQRDLPAQGQPLPVRPDALSQTDHATHSGNFISALSISAEIFS